MKYLASPYTHPEHSVMEVRYRQALSATAYFMKNGEFVFSPIVHCHHLAVTFDMPRDFTFWLNYNLHMLEISDELLVLSLPGWVKSTGVAAEIAFATKQKIPISYIGDFPWQR